jgi:hypothetical protein
MIAAMRNNPPKAKAIGTILAISFIAVFYSLAMAESALDFEVPAPPKSTLTDNNVFTLGGREIRSSLYETKDKIESVTGYYKNKLSEKGFTNIADKYEQLIDQRLLQFKKGDLVVSVTVWKKGEVTVFAVGKYSEPKGAQPIEKMHFSLSDFPPPTQDVAGEDIKVVPRPPQSIRWLGRSATPEISQAMYVSSLSMKDMVAFYRTRMSSLGWQLESERTAKEGLEKYRQVTGKQDLGIANSIEGGKKLEDAILETIMLNFTGSQGRVGLNIMPSYTDKKAGSIIYILYTKPQKK